MIRSTAFNCYRPRRSSTGSLIRSSVFVLGIMLPQANVYPLTKQTKILESHTLTHSPPHSCIINLLALSSSVLLPSESGVRWRLKCSHILASKRLMLLLDGAAAVLPPNLVGLPLGLLGQHLLHAERGQTDSEGRQQSRRSNRRAVGRFRTGNFIYLSVVQANGVSCNLGSLHSLLADVFPCISFH